MKRMHLSVGFLVKPMRFIWHAASGAIIAATAMPVAAATNLADQPVFSDASVPGNLALALSVEYPTAVSVANIQAYGTTTAFLGYFDPEKCYGYQYNATETLRYFYPVGLANNHVCSSTDAAPRWSGNFLNWATMQTIDPFRWALTGGYRVIDDATTTVIEKAYASGQGGTGNFPNRSVSGSTLIQGATPFGWSDFNMRIQGLGNKMRFTRNGNVDNNPTVYSNQAASTLNSSQTYEVSVRVKVCDPSVGAGGLETNCKSYSGGNPKPEGLIQKYSDRIRYSAFGYLNDSNIQRDGGVLRARQKFVGPTQPQPGQSDTVNTLAEWSSTTGVFVGNPDSSDASTTTTLFGPAVGNSGVINYLNKFGQAGSYKTYDPVSELYYAAVRYFKNLGNVGKWTDMSGANAATKATWVDGFPVITTWDDPILYSCQKNYILGIGDVNTHADKNVPGASTPTGNEPTKPTELTTAGAAFDTLNSVTATNKVGVLEGLGTTLGTTNPYNGCCNNNSALIAGIAYDAHTKDIRPDDATKPQTTGMQTISTYWLDVLEYQTYKDNNQYFLATKYGGFKVPSGYDPYAATAAPADALWHTNTDMVGNNKRPDNYYTAAKADEMIAGLTAAFASIASDLKAYTTSFSTVSPQVTDVNNASFSARYDATNWTGELTASLLNFDPVGLATTSAEQWAATDKLAAQLSGTGWDSARRVVSWNGSVGVPFRSTGGISSSQLALLDTSYGAGVDSNEYLNYLRGDRSNEQGSTVVGAKGYRARVALLGDISGSKVTVVETPGFPYSDATNPGYSAFKSAKASRGRMVYVGSNDGMLHAFDGSLTGSSAGREVFAYVPSALYSGPSSPSTPSVDGLAALGNSNFLHHFYVDGTAEVFDIDLARTGGPVTGSPTANWRSVLIGGLGKGGKSYYAIDVTNPGNITTEAIAASNVMWEFPNASTPIADVPLVGFSFGRPVVTKTAKWGWVIVFTSGYNNSDGGGYLFFVNPANGALLEKVATGAGSVAAPSGLAQAQWFVRNRTDNTAESIYAGDLLGNLWRFDVRQASGSYPAPVKIASLTTAAGAGQPVTTRPLIEIDPTSKRRYVLVGTGRLLADTDVNSTQEQTFYGIVDGTESAFNTDTTLPSGITFPVTRNVLVANIALSTGYQATTAKPMGWYLDLGTGASSIGWRMLIDPTSFFGRVAFASTLTSGNACSPSGTSRVYALDFGTGKTVLTGGLDYSTAIAGVITDLRFYSVTSSSGGGTSTGLAGGGNTGGTGMVGTIPPPSLGVRRINWRELPVAQ